jgi:hypothetical protein
LRRETPKLHRAPGPRDDARAPRAHCIDNPVRRNVMLDRRRASLTPRQSRGSSLQIARIWRKNPNRIASEDTACSNLAAPVSVHSRASEQTSSCSSAGRRSVTHCRANDRLVYEYQTMSCNVVKPDRCSPPPNPPTLDGSALPAHSPKRGGREAPAAAGRGHGESPSVEPRRSSGGLGRRARLPPTFPDFARGRLSDTNTPHDRGS